MSENKQIVINKSLHQNLKAFCAENDQKMKDYTEAVLENAIGQKLTIEEIQEKQYKDSYASTQKGGPMIRYGKKENKDDELPEITENVPEEKDEW